MVIDVIRPDAQYSLAETAKILGVHRTTIHRYCESGILTKHYRKATMTPYIKGAELQRFVRAEA